MTGCEDEIKRKIRTLAHFLASLLVYKSSHWLHGFARSSYFYHDNSSVVTHTTSPERKLVSFPGVKFDFGRAIESSLWGGLITILSP